MAQSDPQDLIHRVAKALGRTKPLEAAPTPPAIDEPITRLVHSDIQLVDLFLKRAQVAQFLVEASAAGELCGKLIQFLQAQNCRRIGLSVSPLFESLNLAAALRAAGLEAHTWDQLTLDQTYDLDCGITDVWAAVAETGSLVIRPDPAQGRALSLTPPVHVAIVEPKNVLADLLDLFEKIAHEQPPPNVTVITGPSQTADIEAVMVKGVHGPGVVKVFVVG